MIGGGTRTDLLVTGRIATFAGNPDDGFGWTEAIAVAGGRVVAAGARRDLEDRFGRPVRRLDLPPDRVVLPGLTDAHAHLADLALGARRVDLSADGDLTAALERVRSFADSRPANEWIEGDGWDPVRWNRWPTADDLEGVMPGRRIALWSHDHHAIWVSHAALREAAVDERSPDPAGGLVRRDADGRPSGVLNEAATALVLRRIPPAGRSVLEAAIVQAAHDLVSLGLVAVHDPGEVAADATLERGFAAYAALDARGDLPLRIHACVRRESLPLARERRLRSGMALVDEGPDGGIGGGEATADDGRRRARFGWIKLFADGALGSRTARLLAPYMRDAGLGAPPGGPTGVWVTDPGELGAIVRKASAAGIAAEVHAIGDAAVRLALDVLGPTVGSTSLMPRIEHIQLVDPTDLPRFAAQGVGASVQPVHVRSDAANAWRLWGEERIATGGYPYGSIARTGAVLAFGTDAPVEPVNPWPGIATAVVRRGPAWPPGSPEFVAAERLSLARALRASCVDPALIAGETDRGRLVPGHRADLIVIPGDAVDLPVEPGGALDHVRPELVLIDGEMAFGA